MKLFKKITIVGVGLLGGSIGLAVKKKGLAQEVIGFFRNKKKIASAVKMGVIDRGTCDLKRCMEESDLVILCSPVSDIIKKLKLIKKLGAKNVLITDTGSTKQEIVKAARGLNFVGSHPLAGSEQSGITYARHELFSGSICILTPTGKEASASTHAIALFWKHLGAHAIMLSPREHDNILSFTSHLPHAAAFSLIDAIPQAYLKFCAGGLKDTTRIAMSNPDIWLDIFTSNKKNMLKAIRLFERSLSEFKKALAQDNRQKLLLFLKNAADIRSRITQDP
jgi:prephenate dehydrogenase